jgi:hypothetical protein
MTITEEIKAQILIWINELRSGKYGQTKGMLQGTEGFCCLGLACNTFIAKDSLILKSSKRISGGLPSDQLSAPGWLKSINADFNMRTNHYLSDLNDMGVPDSLNIGNAVEPLTFDEIADLLQAVYIEGVLN